MCIRDRLHDEGGRTIIIISHQERIIRLADEIILISGGQVTGRGTAEEIYPQILADTVTGCNLSLIHISLYLRGEVFQAEIKFAQLSHQSSGLQKRVEPEAKFFLLRLCRARKCPVVAEIDGSLARKVVRRAGKFRVDERHVPVGRREVHAALQGFDIPRERGNQVLVGRFPPPLPRNDAL